MKHTLLILLSCCLLAIGANAQVSHKDKLTGWSIELPTGWEKKIKKVYEDDNSSIMQDDRDFPDNASDYELVNFMYANTSSQITVSVHPIPDGYKSNPSALAEDDADGIQQKLKEMGDTYKDQIKMKVKKGHSTIGSKKIETVTATLVEGGKKTEYRFYEWTEGNYKYVITTTNSEGSMQRLVDDKATSIITSF